MNQVLRISDLGMSFNGTKVLAGVNLSLEPGERLGVLGPSGSGKTTLLRLIAGLEAPTEGEIAIAGKPASRPGAVLTAPEHREVALVFQGLALFPHLRALDQIAFAARGRGGVQHARGLLERVGLGHRADARLDELSGGERQRIALARALAQQPRLILMDEPFASLDDEKRAEMRDLLRGLLEKTQTTLILVTHSRDDALDLAWRALVFELGRAVAQGPLETIMAHPRHVAAVRALGLGQIIEGDLPPGASGGSGTSGGGEVETAFGKVRAGAGTKPGRVRLLVRPAQPQHILEASSAQGVEAEVVSLVLRPPESGEVRRIAVVQAAGQFLRLFVHDPTLTVGQRIRVRINGECEPMEGETH